MFEFNEIFSINRLVKRTIKYYQEVLKKFMQNILRLAFENISIDNKCSEFIFLCSWVMSYIEHFALSIETKQ